MRALLTICAVAVALGACGGPQPPGASAPPIAIGVPRPGVAELWAANPGGGSGVVLERVRRPGMDPRDVCFTVALDGQSSAESDERCVVADPRGGVVELSAAKGVPGRLGRPVEIVGGHAGARVRKLLLEVGDRSHELPVSAQRGFLALLPASWRGSVALTARKADGTVDTQSFDVPRPVQSRPSVRRAGAVFDGEVGKSVIGETEHHLLRRLGRPAARHRSCLRYEQVGRPGVGWTLCLRGGRVARAWGEWP